MTGLGFSGSRWSVADSFGTAFYATPKASRLSGCSVLSPERCDCSWSRLPPSLHDPRIHNLHRSSYRKELGVVVLVRGHRIIYCSDLSRSMDVTQLSPKARNGLTCCGSTNRRSASNSKTLVVLTRRSRPLPNLLGNPVTRTIRWGERLPIGPEAIFFALDTRTNWLGRLLSLVFKPPLCTCSSNMRTERVGKAITGGSFPPLRMAAS